MTHSKLTKPLFIAGPCSAESEGQLREVVDALSSIEQVQWIRCGVWKPRTRPGGFEGCGEEALFWIDQLRRQYPTLRFCCEVAQPSHIEAVLRHHIDAVWIGARTTANPFSLSELAQTLRGAELPVLVKNAPIPDVRLWIGAIERIIAAGVSEVGAIHRGFSTYSNNGLRNNPLWEIPIELRRQMPDLLMLCDPSHIAGRRDKVAHVASMALDMGFDGLMIECHHAPDKALTDAAQQITPNEAKLMLQHLTPRRGDSETSEQLLHDLRGQIDEVDSQLLALLCQRMSISKKIASIKRKHNISVLQNRRWDSLLANRTEQARALNLNEGFVKEMFEKIHAESVRTQIEENE